MRNFDLISHALSCASVLLAYVLLSLIFTDKRESNNIKIIISSHERGWMEGAKAGAMYMASDSITFAEFYRIKSNDSSSIINELNKINQ